MDEKLKAELRESVASVIKDAEGQDTTDKTAKGLMKLAGIVDELIKNA